MPRQVALEVIERVLREDAYSHIALSYALDKAKLRGPDRGLATRLVYGVLTWKSALDRIIDQFVKGGLRRLQTEIHDILRLAVYQLVFLERIPDHAAINEAVEQAKRVQPRAAGLVNGVLRAVARAEDITWWREQDREKKPAKYLGQRYSLPTWLANRLFQTFGVEQAERVAASFASDSKLWARPRQGFSLGDEHWDAAVGVPGAIALDGWSDDVRAALEDHSLTIQDLGSQLIGLLTGPVEGSHVLDACAGLGGKSLHFLDRGAASVTSVEPLRSKLELLRPLADHRLVTREATLQEFASGHNGTFDVVLVDAPCTGLGVLRRHPETRWRRTEADIQELAALQRELLEAATNLVAPGGVLVYSVCTFTREEGPKQVELFLERHPEFSLEPVESNEAIDWSEFTNDAGQLVTWPHLHDSDAFFAARLRRAS